MNEETLQDKSLTVLLGLVSIAFIWILLPFYGAVFWAVILGILFAPMQRRMQLKFGWQRNVTSLLTLSICLVIAILPVIILSVLLVQEGATLYKSIESGELDIAGVCDALQAQPAAVLSAFARSVRGGRAERPAGENHQECGDGQ